MATPAHRSAAAAPRAAHVDMRRAGDIDDDRLIVNYEWKF